METKNVPFAWVESGRSISCYSAIFQETSFKWISVPTTVRLILQYSSGRASNTCTIMQIWRALEQISAALNRCEIKGIVFASYQQQPSTNDKLKCTNQILCNCIITKNKMHEIIFHFRSLTHITFPPYLFILSCCFRLLLQLRGH